MNALKSVWKVTALAGLVVTATITPFLDGEGRAGTPAERTTRAAANLDPAAAPQHEQKEHAQEREAAITAAATVWAAWIAGGAAVVSALIAALVAWFTARSQVKSEQFKREFAHQFVNCGLRESLVKGGFVVTEELQALMGRNLPELILMNGSAVASAIDSRANSIAYEIFWRLKAMNRRPTLASYLTARDMEEFREMDNLSPSWLESSHGR